MLMPGKRLAPTWAQGRCPARAERERPPPASRSGADTRSHCSTLSDVSPRSPAESEGPSLSTPQAPHGRNEAFGAHRAAPAPAGGPGPGLPLTSQCGEGTAKAPGPRRPVSRLGRQPIPTTFLGRTISRLAGTQGSTRPEEGSASAAGARRL